MKVLTTITLPDSQKRLRAGYDPIANGLQRVAIHGRPSFRNAATIIDFAITSATMITAERDWLVKAVSLLSEFPMEKIDLKKQYKTLYSAPVGDFSILDVPPLTYFAIDGAGDPNAAPEYTAAVEALYAASYTLKFMSKETLKRDYVVPPLEGLWWADDMADFITRRKDRWRWRMMILVPDFIGKAMA